MVLTLLIACESSDKYAGTYKAEGQELTKQGEIILELKASGDGVWRVGSNDVFSEVPITWYIRRGELRINTKGGGILVGKIEKETIQMTLPGSKVMTFKKIQ
jgi:hypothetical protein